MARTKVIQSIASQDENETKIMALAGWDRPRNGRLHIFSLQPVPALGGLGR
jgi:hypothetical protein